MIPIQGRIMDAQDILELAVGDVLQHIINGHACLPSPVVSIHARGQTPTGAPFVCFYQALGANARISGSTHAGEDNYRLVQKAFMTSDNLVPFAHSEDQRLECWTHVDMRGWIWQVFRHRFGPGAMARTWFAVVHDPGEFRTEMLNTQATNPDGTTLEGLLYNLPDNEPFALITAMQALIATGNWPVIQTYVREHLPDLGQAQPALF